MNISAHSGATILMFPVPSRVARRSRRRWQLAALLALAVAALLAGTARQVDGRDLAEASPAPLLLD